MRELAEDEFYTESLQQVSAESTPKSRIYISGKPTESTIPGAHLEACLLWNNSFLVFTTDDIPNEDMLHVILLGPDLDVLDFATIGSAYSTGNFRSLSIKGDNLLGFEFIGGTTWTLELFRERRHRIPLISDPKGVIRKFSFSCRFKLFGNPLPDK
jgi:hypothetical protein